jgi:hypothetical protein
MRMIVCLGCTRQHLLSAQWHVFGAYLAAWTTRSRRTPTADAAAPTSSCAAGSAAPPCTPTLQVVAAWCGGQMWLIAGSAQGLRRLFSITSTSMYQLTTP